MPGTKLRNLYPELNASVMKWETVTSGIGQKVYALWDNGRKLLTLAFNSSSNFAKIEYGQEKRAFIIRYEGLFKNKMVMRNEYGIRIGQVTTEKDNLIALNDEKLFYTITHDKEPKVILYKESVDKPLAVCALQLENEKGVLPSVKPTATQHSLLLAMSWYLLRSAVTKEKTAEFA